MKNLDNLKVIEESGKYIWCYCPFHNDTERPNLCINKIEYRGKPIGYYFCYACGALGKISEKQVDKLATKKGYVKKSRLVNWCQLAVQYTAGVLSQNYPGDFIYEESSEDYMLGWDSFDEHYTAPMYNAEQKVIGIHTRFLDGTKRSIEGSKLGLFLPQWSIEPQRLEGKTIIICEGLSDTLVAYHCTGLYSIGLPSATFGHTIVRDFLKNISFNGDITVVVDCDEAGFESVNKLTEILKNQYPLMVILPTPYLDLYENYKHCEVEKIRKLLLPGDENESM